MLHHQSLLLLSLILLLVLLFVLVAIVSCHMVLHLDYIVEEDALDPQGVDVEAALLPGSRAEVMQGQLVVVLHHLEQPGLRLFLMGQHHHLVAARLVEVSTHNLQTRTHNNFESDVMVEGHCEDSALCLLVLGLLADFRLTSCKCKVSVAVRCRVMSGE